MKQSRVKVNAHVARRGLLLGYEAIGVWRYLPKRRRSKLSTFFV